MLGSILCLLLSGLAVIKGHDDPDPFHKPSRTNVLRRWNIPGCVGISCSSMSTGLKDVHRHKRALPASFKTAWVKLIATTYGFRWLSFYWGKYNKYKYYIKVGTTDDALEDFKSLRLTGVRRKGDYLVGKVGNQKVTLFLPSSHSSAEAPLLQVGYPRFRQIVYAETTQNAKFILQNIQKAMDGAQKDMISPTFH